MPEYSKTGELLPELESTSPAIKMSSVDISLETDAYT